VEDLNLKLHNFTNGHKSKCKTSCCAFLAPSSPSEMTRGFPFCGYHRKHKECNFVVLMNYFKCFLQSQANSEHSAITVVFLYRGFWILAFWQLWMENTQRKKKELCQQGVIVAYLQFQLLRRWGKRIIWAQR
jgi:hypothetical protein